MSRWGGNHGWRSHLRGLYTRYAYGGISKDALVRALRRYADQREAYAERIATILPQLAWLEHRQAQALRKEADNLEQEQEEA